MSQFSTVGKTIGNIKTSTTSPSSSAQENELCKRFDGVGHTQSAKYTGYVVKADS